MSNLESNFSMKGTITKAKVLQYLRKTKTIDSDIANVLLSIVDGISADDFSVITEMAEAGQDISLFLDIDEYEIYSGNNVYESIPLAEETTIRIRKRQFTNRSARLE